MVNASVLPEVQEYFDALDAEKRAVVLPVFEAVREAMPEGYQLGLHWGMPGRVVPLERFPERIRR